MDRALQGTAFTAKLTLYQGSVATDPSPDSATIEVKRSDGTVIQVAGTSVTGTGTGTFSYTLSPTHTSLLDTLELKWSLTTNAILQTVSTRVEVVGGFLCTLADLAGVLPGLTDDQLAQARTTAETRLESACNMAFVPRYTIETRRAFYPGRVRLSLPNVRTVRTASVRTNVVTTLTTPQIALLTYDAMGLSSGTWPTGANLSIGYEHGLDFADEDCHQATILVAREASRMATSDGIVTREEADNVSVSYARITSGSFANPAINAFVEGARSPLVA